MKFPISRIPHAAIAMVASLGLVACGGTDTATGVFKDSKVSGIHYESGGQQGTTDADGTFTYEVGQPVTFSIGGVTIGTATGKSVMTPLDLVTNGSGTSTTVRNIARFLQMLDFDGDPSNGITISTAVQNAAANWSAVDFTTSDIESELVSKNIVSDAASVDGTTHTVPDATTAAAHLQSTFLCTYAGAFRGTYSGDDSGNFGVLVDASSGLVSGFAYSNSDQTLGILSGTTGVSFDQTASFASGDTSSGGSFSGQFSSPDAVSGTWADPQFSQSGSFSGNRIGGASNAAYRFTGSYTGDDFGLFAFDVDASDSITGVAYSVLEDQLFTLSGSVSGTTVTAQTNTGTSITGTLNKSTGALSGSWTATDSSSGSYSGDGCKLI